MVFHSIRLHGPGKHSDSVTDEVSHRQSCNALRIMRPHKFDKIEADNLHLGSNGMQQIDNLPIGEPTGDRA